MKEIAQVLGMLMLGCGIATGAFFWLLWLEHSA